MDSAPQTIKADQKLAQCRSTGVAIGSQETRPVGHLFHVPFAIAEILGRTAKMRELPVEDACQAAVVDEEIVKPKVAVHHGQGSFDAANRAFKPAEDGIDRFARRVEHGALCPILVELRPQLIVRKGFCRDPGGPNELIGPKRMQPAKLLAELERHALRFWRTE